MRITYAITIVTILAMLAGCSDRQPLAPMFDTARWSEARASVDGPTLPCAPALAEAMADQCRKVLSASAARAARLRAWGRAPDWTRHHAALWSLATEMPAARAVAKFEAQLTREQADPTLWNDLAAAYYNARRHGEDWRALEASLAAVQSALDYAPEYGRALYNQALILEELALVDAAVSAWEEYLPRAERSDWRRLATGRLEGLRASTDAMDRVSQRGRAIVWRGFDPDRLTTDATVRRRLRSELIGALLDRGTLLRELGQEAASVCASASAAKRRALVALERGTSGGASLLEDTFAWLCVEDTPARAQTLSRLGEAAAAYQSIGPEQSHTLAQEVHAALSASRAPLGGVARLLEGQSLFAQERYVEPELLLAMESALDDAAAGPYAVVAARAHERLGSSALRRARSDEALRHYRRAEALLGEGQDVARLARIRALRANALSLFGRHDRAWETILQTLAQAREEVFPRATVLTLCEMGAIVATFSEAPHLRERFADCAVRKLSEDDDPSLRTYTYLNRGAARQELGKASLAAADFDASRAAAADTIEPREALLNHTAIALEESLATLMQAPRRVLQPLRRARDVYQANGNRESEFRARRGLVRAHEALGDEAAASAQREDLVPFLAAALEADDPAVTRWRYQHDRSTYESQVRSLVRTGRHRDALAELVRLRQPKQFAGQTAQAIVEAARPSARDGQSALTLIYAWLEDAIAVWRVDGEGDLVFYEASIEGQAAVDWQALVERAADTAAAPLAGGRQEALNQLHDALLRPALGGVPANTRLHLMPDGPLYGLPWPALLDRQTQSYLVEQFVIDVVVELRAPGAGSSSAPPPVWRRVAVFADPKADSYQPLPRVADDARVIRETLTPRGATVIHYKGAALSENSFVQSLSESDLVHYAGHGTVDVWDPAKSELVIRADGEGKVLEAVTARDLDALAARRAPMPDLVVLAACDTAAYSDRLPHSVALVRPLLESGTRQVMGALRPLPDEQYHALIKRFYQGLAEGQAPARALMLAQRSQVFDETPGEVAAWQFVQLYRFE